MGKYGAAAGYNGVDWGCNDCGIAVRYVCGAPTVNTANGTPRVTRRQSRAAAPSVLAI